jgi:hypothetical protein
MKRPPPARTRPADWPERLAAHTARWRATPFAWGQHDCATFAAGWVLEIHGFDPLEPLRGAYATEAEYLGLLEDAGGLLALMQRAAARNGLPECGPAFAQRGDIALVRLGNEECVGLVDAVGVTVPTCERLRIAPRSAILHAWAV